VLILFGVGLAAGLLPRSRQRAVVASETRELAVQSVFVTNPAPAKAGATLVLSAELRPLMEVVIYARATGYVRRWMVDLGARVESGQLLAELDTPELDRELAEARAGLAQAEAARSFTETTAKRWREMLAARTVSSQEADEKAADFILKQTTVEVARAHVQRLEELAGFARITAPFPGTITARRLDVGQLVNAGSGQELFRLAQTEKLRAFVRIPQSCAHSVVIGQSAELSLVEMPGRVCEAKVVRTAGVLDAASRTLLTELEVDNAKGDLFAGSYAQLRLPDAKPDAVLAIPANAVLFRPEGTLVGVVGADNHVAMRKIVMGRDSGQTIEILEGLTQADKVVLNPPDSLVDGSEIRVAGTIPATP
jgi:RND family efflux transporter MFP subunit